MAAPAVLVDAGPTVGDLAGRWIETSLDELPSAPFQLTDERLAVAAHVVDEDTAGAVLLAAARGVAVVVAVDLPPASEARFVDDLARVADMQARQEATSDALGGEHIALLEALAAGLTVAAAARRVGLSSRTAVRRLSEARDRLGAATNTEAVRRYSDLHRNH
jgi:DNA-binding NarL/FixJ family response regulator